MLYTTWVGICLVSFALTVLALRGTGVAYASLLSAAGYGLATVTARNLQRFFQDGTSATVDNGAGVQLLLLAVTVLSIAMFVLWLVGEYRPAEADEPRQTDEEPVQDGFGPTDRGVS